MLKIRLRREGSRNHPFYRLVVSDSKNTPTGPVVETIGYYNPKSNPAAMHVDAERYQAWVAKGAHPSETVANLIRNQLKQTQ